MTRAMTGAPTGRGRRLLALLIPLIALLPLLLTPNAQAWDSRWRFYVNDTTFYNSPWYAGGHRIMIGYGCTGAPYYDPDPRCRHDNGFHHGLDVAMGCGTRLKAGIAGWVVRHDDLGPAYGSNPVKIRNYDRGIDIVIGHTRQVYAKPGDRLSRGEVFALASDNGAPDGCHLHFEVRDLGGGLSTATWPRPLLRLTAVS